MYLFFVVELRWFFVSTMVDRVKEIGRWEKENRDWLGLGSKWIGVSI
jgi:hypothetical protein